MSRGIRVYELAREVDVHSKDILRLLQEKMNIELNNHMSTINDQVAAKVRRLIAVERGEVPAAAGGKAKPAKGEAPAAARPKGASSAPGAPGGGTAGAQGTRGAQAAQAARGSQAAREAPAAPSEARQAQEAKGGARMGGPETASSTGTPATAGNGTASPAPAPAVPALSEEELNARRERARAALSQREAARPRPKADALAISSPIAVGELASKLGVGPAEVIKRLLGMGVMAAINQQLDPDKAAAVAREFGVEVSTEAAAGGAGLKGSLTAALAGDDPARLALRPPVITVLGHVDHGKTTLLDAIRESHVAEGEAGGITQHIGASVVDYQGRRLVFLDTPGHEAFTAMRARGAMVTDIAVLVVAADDGVMPQTVEAISHAKAAGVPIVVALNKIDRPNANPDRVLQQLSEHELVPEDWGGDTVVVPVSALRRQGLDELMEMLLLVADVQELKADAKRRAVGTVVEARLERGRGPVATVLVQTGTLRLGDAFICGNVSGRVRAMVDDRGRQVRDAGPSTPVGVTGFSDLPAAGDLFEVMADERAARGLGQKRTEERRREAIAGAGRAITLVEFHQRAQEGGSEDLKVIVKADVQGSLEALRSSLDKLRQEEVRTVVLHGGVGPITESDVMLAAASGAVVLGFNIRPDTAAEREAERQHVEIKTYRVIYELLDDVRQAMAGKLAPKFEEVVVGRAEVRATFKVPNVGTVAGCYVQDGVVKRGGGVRVVRDGTVVYEGNISSLKRFQDDVREVATGYECGIGVEKFNDIKEGDILEIFEQREVART